MCRDAEVRFVSSTAKAVEATPLCMSTSSPESGQNCRRLSRSALCQSRPNALQHSQSASRMSFLLLENGTVVRSRCRRAAAIDQPATRLKPNSAQRQDALVLDLYNRWPGIGRNRPFAQACASLQGRGAADRPIRPPQLIAPSRRRLPRLLDRGGQSRSRFP